MKTYLCIDLKSFYASVECCDMGLDPLKTRLVVADESRTDGTICLAVSPALKEYGIPGRPRLFEVKRRIRQIRHDTGLDLDFIIAVPRMGRYVEVSSQIYEVYLKYISPDDIHVYSIDEVFIDLTSYIELYKTDAHTLTMNIIRDVLKETGITATAGIGTNMYLAKIAMDIVAKHCPPDEDGVRIAQLDEMSFRRTLWTHTPLTDFWMTGRGTAARLAEHGLFTMGDVARMSLSDEEFFYREFGINGEILIDHAWGIEPCTMSDIKKYRAKTHSLSSGQVLPREYKFDEALLVIKEMSDLLAMDLKTKRLLTSSITIYIGYGRSSGSGSAHGTKDLQRSTSSASEIRKATEELFRASVDPGRTIRRLNICANNTIPEEAAQKQIDMFDQIDTPDKEDDVMRALLDIRSKYGKNAILRGMNLKEGATARERNEQIGGHRK